MIGDSSLTIEILNDGSVTSAAGFLAGVADCGLKRVAALDLVLLYSERDCAAAGVFTRNQVVAAPVILDRETLAGNRERIRGVVANAGNANACTGQPGIEAARAMQRMAAEVLGCKPEQILVLSTGVIGVPLPLDRVGAGIELAAGDLSPGNGAAAARAIMTTDTRPKTMAVRLPLAGGAVTIGGMAKGAGMIYPNMATMLAVITTDAALPADTLQAMLRRAVDGSFNRICIDGDTSTNDSVLMLANGVSGIELDADSLEMFAAGLDHVCAELARMIVRDGEGATRFVTIWVSGASDNEAAHAIAETIATSPLVKTALAGGDPNWGRILAAAGRAGVTLDQAQLALWIGEPEQPPLQLVAGGISTPYLEPEAAAIFASSEINIHLDLGAGNGETTIWTCDLTQDYVTINASYRT